MRAELVDCCQEIARRREPAAPGRARCDVRVSDSDVRRHTTAASSVCPYGYALGTYAVGLIRQYACKHADCDTRRRLHSTCTHTRKLSQLFRNRPLTPPPFFCCLCSATSSSSSPGRRVRSPCPVSCSASSSSSSTALTARADTSVWCRSASQESFTLSKPRSHAPLPARMPSITRKNSPASCQPTSSSSEPSGASWVGVCGGDPRTDRGGRSTLVTLGMVATGGASASLSTGRKGAAASGGARTAGGDGRWEGGDGGRGGAGGGGSATCRTSTGFASL